MGIEPMLPGTLHDLGDNQWTRTPTLKLSDHPNKRFNNVGERGKHVAAALSVGGGHSFSGDRRIRQAGRRR